MRNDNGIPKKQAAPAVLLVKTSSLGDVIHNLPVVSDIKAHFPECTVDWVVEEQYAALLKMHPGVRNVIPVAWRRWRRAIFSPANWQEFFSFRRSLNERYQYIIDSQGLLKSALIAFNALGVRFGYDRVCAREPIASYFYHHHYFVPPTMHATERNRALAGMAMRYSVEGSPNFGLYPASWSGVDFLPSSAVEDSDHSKIIVFLTAASRENKFWPENNWLELGKLLAGFGFLLVFPWGNTIEQERCQRIASKVSNSIVAPRLGIEDLATVLSKSRLLIGLDTGVTHLGAALGRPTIGIFSASEPSLTGVCGRNDCMNLGQNNAPPSLKAVQEAAMKLLNISISN